MIKQCLFLLLLCSLSVAASQTKQDIFLEMKARERAGLMLLLQEIRKQHAHAKEISQDEQKYIEVEQFLEILIRW